MASSSSMASFLPSSLAIPARLRALARVRCSVPSDASPPPPPLLGAAKYTVDKYIKSGMVVGLGSGNASSMAIKYLGQQLRAGALEDIVGIAIDYSKGLVALSLSMSCT